MADADPLPKLPKRVTLMGVALDAVTGKQALDYIAACARQGVGGWVVTPNLDILRRCVTDASFRALIEPCSLRLADGMPLIWASWVQGTALPERVAGSDLILSLTARAASEGLSVFLLGGDPGVAEEAAEKLCERCKGLRVVGTLCPPFGFEKDEAFVRTMREQLASAKPNVVYVALGSPKQEKLIDSLRTLLPSAWFLGIGISFSFVTGDVRRAPVWMQKTGLEWVHRLVQDPGRLFRRYIIDGLPFAARLLLHAAWVRVRRAD